MALARELESLRQDPELIELAKGIAQGIKERAASAESLERKFDANQFYTNQFWGLLKADGFLSRPTEQRKVFWQLVTQQLKDLGVPFDATSLVDKVSKGDKAPPKGYNEKTVYIPEMAEKSFQECTLAIVRVQREQAEKEKKLEEDKKAANKQAVLEKFQDIKKHFPDIDKKLSGGEKKILENYINKVLSKGEGGGKLFSLELLNEVASSPLLKGKGELMKGLRDLHLAEKKHVEEVALKRKSGDVHDPSRRPAAPAATEQVPTSPTSVRKL